MISIWLNIVINSTYKKLPNLSEQFAITDAETLDEVMNCLSRHLNISTQGADDRDYLLKILVKTASMGDTIENTIKNLKEVSSSNTIRYHLNKLNDFDDLEKSLNSAWKSPLLPQGKKTRLRLAIDFNLIPYYGEPSVDELPFPPFELSITKTDDWRSI